MSTKNDTTRQEAIQFLLLPESKGGAGIKPGEKVYTILRHRSSSGMSRVIDMFVIRKDSWSKKHRPCFIGFKAAQAMGDTWDRERQGIKVSGCGMDMGFHLVYSLGEALWPKGTRKPHSKRNGTDDRAGGYALKHEWI